MVSIDNNNSFELREYALKKVCNHVGSDTFKSCFIQFLGLTDNLACDFDLNKLSLYKKCVISGLRLGEDRVSHSDLLRLFGQASSIDSTPMPWVSDLIGVMSIKWLVDGLNDDDIQEHFQSWIGSFIPQQIQSGRLNKFESDIARYIHDPLGPVLNTALVPLTLHYLNIVNLPEQHARQEKFSGFMSEFREYVTSDTLSPMLMALMIYCFDHVSTDLILFPPNGWSLKDLEGFLNRIPVGLKRWTWEEERGRTRNSEPVKWPIENEYHVQNLLYALLAPVFDDIADEVNLQQVGQKNPRADLYIPGLHVIIEVKYRKDTKKTFSKLIGEVAEDASLYHADSKYKDARFVCFLWDHTRSTQEHAKFKEGVLSISGIDTCVIVNAPSFM